MEMDYNQMLYDTIYLFFKRDMIGKPIKYAFKLNWNHSIHENDNFFFISWFYSKENSIVSGLMRVESSNEKRFYIVMGGKWNRYSIDVIMVYYARRELSPNSYTFIQLGWLIC